MGCATFGFREVSAIDFLDSHRSVWGLEKPLDAPVVIDVHAKCSGLFSETGHPHDVSREHDEEARTRRGPDPPDLEGPSRRRAERPLVVAQAELGLRDADREAVQARSPEAG